MSAYPVRHFLLQPYTKLFQQQVRRLSGIKISKTRKKEREIRTKKGMKRDEAQLLSKRESCAQNDEGQKDEKSGGAEKVGERKKDVYPVANRYFRYFRRHKIQNSIPEYMYTESKPCDKNDKNETLFCLLTSHPSSIFADGRVNTLKTCNTD